MFNCKSSKFTNTRDPKSKTQMKFSSITFSDLRDPIIILEIRTGSQNTLKCLIIQEFGQSDEVAKVSAKFRVPVEK